MKDQSAEKSHYTEIATNKKAYFQYEILETFETGIVLKGTEIKSLRENGASLQEAFVTVLGNELFLVNSSIPPYRYGTVYNHEEKRKRKLLAHKKEIMRIGSQIQEKGLTCIPLSIFLKNGLAKVKIGLGRGKKLHDKRDDIKEREDTRNIQRAMKTFND